MTLSLIRKKILEIRGKQVILDMDLAELYCVETRVLKQAVRRNMDRFPDDFMFKLSETEIESMVSQFVIPSKGQFGGALPFAFTEQGIAMLSSVLKSPVAIQVNIEIMRVFISLREYAMDYHNLSEKLKTLETVYNEQFDNVFEALNYLLQKEVTPDPAENREQIGYKSA